MVCAVVRVPASLIPWAPDKGAADFGVELGWLLGSAVRTHSLHMLEIFALLNLSNISKLDWSVLLGRLSSWSLIRLHFILLWLVITTYLFLLLDVTTI